MSVRKKFTELFFFIIKYPYSSKTNVNNKIIKKLKKSFTEGIKYAKFSKKKFSIK